MKRRALYLEITLALHAWRRGQPSAMCGNSVQAIYRWACGAEQA